MWLKHAWRQLSSVRFAQFAPWLLLGVVAVTLLASVHPDQGPAQNLARLCAGIIVWSVLLTLYRFALGRTIVWLLAALLPFELVSRLVFRTFLTPGILQSIALTTPRESVEILGRHPEWIWLGVPYLFFAVCNAVLAWSGPNPFKLRQLLIATCLAGLGLLPGTTWLYYSDQTAQSMLYQFVPSREPASPGVLVRRAFREMFPVDGLYSALVIVRSELFVRAEFRARSRFVFEGVRRSVPAPGPETYVVVVGESSRRASWSLFGYPRDTNPELARWLGRGLYLFTNIRANANLTIFSIPLTLTRATPREQWRSAQERSIIGLAAQAGFDTHWISNQGQYGIWDRRVSAIAADANHVHFLPRLSDGLSEYDENYDEALIPAVAAVLRTPAANPKRVIFVHTMGGHFDYRRRVPPTRTVFSDPAFRNTRVCCLPEQRARTSDAYDDTVLYTDRVVSSLIDMLAGLEGTTALLYFADHGERLYCPRYPLTSFSHGNLIPSAGELDVPVFVWLSEAYRSTYPGTADAAQRNQALRTSLGSMFDTVADLAHIESTHIRPNTSLLTMNPAPATQDVMAIDGHIRLGTDPDEDCADAP